MGLGNDMGLHKRHGETVVLEGLGLVVLSMFLFFRVCQFSGVYT